MSEPKNPIQKTKAKIPEIKIPSARPPLILNTFGLGMARTAIYKAGAPKTTYKQDQFGFIPEVNADNSKANLGSLVFSNLEIKGAKWINSRNENEQLPTADLSFSTVLFEVSQSKNIVTTAIQGRAGTVKEFISDGDFKINIRGVITGPNMIYPKDAVANLVKALSAPVALNVDSWFLSLFEIYNIVVTDFSMPQVEGGQSMQPFQITAVSDTPIELTTKQITRLSMTQVIGEEPAPASSSSSSSGTKKKQTTGFTFGGGDFRQSSAYGKSSGAGGSW